MIDRNPRDSFLRLSFPKSMSVTGLGERGAVLWVKIYFWGHYLWHLQNTLAELFLLSLSYL